MSSCLAAHVFPPCAQYSGPIQTGQSHRSRASSRVASGCTRFLFPPWHCASCRRHGRRITTAQGGFESQSNSPGVRRDDDDEQSSAAKYVAMRTYRKALLSLRVTGEALPWQVTAAMAADGGRMAAQELAQGKPMLVIETFIPGRFSQGSSVATKLQAPTRLVVEETRQGRSSSSPSGGRAFAIAFQAVRLLKLAKFELCFYRPGTSRDMDNYIHDQKADIVGFVEVVDGSALAAVAKAVSTYALACVQENVQQRVVVEGLWTKLSRLWHKAKQITIESSAVRISSLPESEVMAHVDMMLLQEGANPCLGSSMGLRRRHPWWERLSSTRSKSVDDIHQMIDEFVPAHEIEFKLTPHNVRAVGLQMKTSDGDTCCKVQLTHVQMIDLADVLDMYCGDQYTCPQEKCSTNLDITVPHRTWSKVTQTLWVGALASALGGALLLGMLSLGKLRGRSTETPSSVSLTSTPASAMSFLDKFRETHRNQEPVIPMMDHVSQKEMDALCGLVVAMVKDAFGWPHGIETCGGEGAWMGTNLMQLGRTPSQFSAAIERPVDGTEDEILVTETNSFLTETGEVTREGVDWAVETGDSRSSETSASPQEEIMVYQVLMSRDGKVLGFQPGSLNAINNWASFPYAKMLHEAQTYRTGLFERGLKYSGRPDDCAVLELLVRDAPAAPAASARPFFGNR